MMVFGYILLGLALGVIGTRFWDYVTWLAAKHRKSF